MGTAAIDPAGFTALRLAAGALVLGALVISGTIRRSCAARSSGSWASAAMLFL